MESKVGMAKGAKWFFALKLLQNVFQFLYLVVLARLLEPSAFGVFVIFGVIVGFINIVSEVGLGAALVQQKNITDIDVHSAYACMFSFSMAITLLLMWMSPDICSFLNVNDYAVHFKVMMCVIPLASLCSIRLSLLQRDFLFKKMALVYFCSYFISHIVIGLIFSLFYPNVWVLICSVLMQYLFQVIFLYWPLNKLRIRFSVKIESIRRLTDFGFGLSIGEIASYIANQADNIIIGKYLSSGDLGYYSRAYQLMLMPVTLIGLVADKLMFPLISKNQESTNFVASAYVMSISLGLSISSVITTYLVIYSDSIILFLFGDGWNVAAELFSVFAMFFSFRFIYKINDIFTKSLGYVYKRAFGQILYAITVIVVSLLVVSDGVEYVAYGVGLAIFINFTYSSLLCVYLIKCDLVSVIVVYGKHMFLFFLIYFLNNLLSKFFDDYFSYKVVVLLVGAIFCFASHVLCYFLLRKLFNSELNFVFSLGRNSEKS